MVSVTHIAVSGRKITRTDYNTTEHAVTGAANKYLGFDSEGNLEEKDAPVGSGSLPYVNVADYLDEDRVEFVTDDLPAFEAAIAALNQETGYAAGGIIHIPAGRYYCSDTVATTSVVHFRGEGSAQSSGLNTLIRFAKNRDGFDLGGAGSSLSCVQLWGGNVNVDGTGTVTTYAAGDSPTGTGVLVSHDFILVDDVMCALFGEDGFRADATGIEQANSFIFYRCQAIYNGRHGFVMYGEDANAGKTDTCSAIDNGGYGFYDASFLGNGHFNNHTRGNGVIDPTGNNNPVGCAKYGGVGYYVVAGQETAASTTQPGTDESVWATYPNCPLGSLVEWVSGTTYISTGAYGTNVANANCYNCMFVNCYAENSQVPSQVFNPAAVYGGLFNERSPLSTAAQVIHYSNALGSQAFRTQPDSSGRYAFLGYAYGLVDPDTAFGWHDGTNLWRMQSSGRIHRAGVPIVGFTANGVDLESGKSLYANGTKVVGAQGAAVADATDAASAITQLNALLARCRAHGLIAT